MVDTRRLKQFIKLADLDDSDIVEFIDEGKIAEKDFSKAQDGSQMKVALVMKVSLNGEDPKEITLNNTTINILKKDWGSDSANWVGRRARVATVETLSFGELKEVNVLKPIANEPPPAPTPVEPEVEPDVAPARKVGQFCQCGANSTPMKSEENPNIEICTQCDKPVTAWDE